MTSKINRPVAFLPIECTPREFDYKLNLARHFLNAGYDVMIGNPPFLRDELKYKNFTGVFLEKGVNPDPAYYNDLKQRNILLYCLSDEGAAHPAFSVTYKPAVDALKTMEKIFLWGEFQYNDLIDRNTDSELNDKYHVTGNPGFEFSLPTYKEYNRKLKPESLPKEYILVNTNFAIYNGFSVAETREACTAMSPETLRDIEEMAKHDEKAFKNFYAWLIEIIKAFPQQQFLVRPHPSEKIEKYIEYFADYQNVVVSKQGSVNQVISSAKLVIHRDCTTALQSFLMGIPVVSFIHSNYAHIHSPWSLAFGAQPQTVGEAQHVISYILQHNGLEPDMAANINSAAAQNMAERFSNLGNSTKEILLIMVPKMRELLNDFKPYKVTDARTLLQKLKLAIRKFLPLHYKVPHASRGLLLPFSEQDIRKRLDLLQAVDGLHISCNIQKLFPNAYLLSQRKHI